MASSWPGSIAANAALLGAYTTYGPFSRTGTMLTAGLAWPEINELNVEMSGMLAITWPTGWSAYALLANGALIVNGTAATIAAIPAAAPNPLLARVFNVGSFVRSHRMLRAAGTQRQSRSEGAPTLQPH